MIGKRLTVRGLESMCAVMWGFSPVIITLIVDEMGALRALRWFIANMPRYLISTAVLGSVRTHLACAIASLRNGCVYCAYAHVYALELIYLRERGKLFPLNAGELDPWLTLDTRVMRRRLHAALVEAGLHYEALWVDRMLLLIDGPQLPVDAEEARIVHLMCMATTMNKIAIAGGAQPDEAHDPVNKNTAIKSRHAALRASSSI